MSKETTKIETEATFTSEADSSSVRVTNADQKRVSQRVVDMAHKAKAEYRAGKTRPVPAE